MRFSLRFLLVASMLSAILIGMLSRGRQQTLRGIELLELAGAHVTRVDSNLACELLPQYGSYDIDMGDSHEADSSLLKWFRSIRTLRWKSPDANDFENIASIPCIQEMEISNGNDTICLGLGRIPSIQRLSVAGKDFTGSNLGFLKKLSRLRLLDLEGTSISDRCLPAIADCGSLSELNVRRTNVSEDGLCTHLGTKLGKSLTKICVDSIKVMGIEESSLKRTFPRCSVEATLTFRLNRTVEQGPKQQ
jgi:hypothetical protein